MKSRHVLSAIVGCVSIYTFAIAGISIERNAPIAKQLRGETRHDGKTLGLYLDFLEELCGKSQLDLLTQRCERPGFQEKIVELRAAEATEKSLAGVKELYRRTLDGIVASGDSLRDLIIFHSPSLDDISGSVGDAYKLKELYELNVGRRWPVGPSSIEAYKAIQECVARGDEPQNEGGATVWCKAKSSDMATQFELHNRLAPSGSTRQMGASGPAACAAKGGTFIFVDGNPLCSMLAPSSPRAPNQ